MSAPPASTTRWSSAASQKKEQCEANKTPFEDHTEPFKELVDWADEWHIPGTFAMDSYSAKPVERSCGKGSCGKEGLPDGGTSGRRVRWDVLAFFGLDKGIHYTIVYAWDKSRVVAHLGLTGDG